MEKPAIDIELRRLASTIMDNGKSVEETHQPDDDSATQERRFWETYLAVIQQRMRLEKEQGHENTEDTA